MYFWVNELEVGANDGIFSGDVQQKVYNVTRKSTVGISFQAMKLLKTTNRL